jgi:hypothetical protein
MPVEARVKKVPTNEGPGKESALVMEPTNKQPTMMVLQDLPPIPSHRATITSLRKENMQLRALLDGTISQISADHALKVLMEDENGSLRQQLFTKENLKGKKQKTINTHARHMTSEENMIETSRAEFHALFAPVVKELRDRAAAQLQAAKEAEKTLKDAKREAEKQQRATEKEAERRWKEAERKQKEVEREIERQQKDEEKARKAAAAAQLKVQKDTERAEKLREAAAAKAKKAAARAAEKVAKEVVRAGQKRKNDEHNGLDTPGEALQLVDSLTLSPAHPPAKRPRPRPRPVFQDITSQQNHSKTTEMDHQPQEDHIPIDPQLLDA